LRILLVALGRIIGGIRDSSLDRVSIIRQLALIVNLVHNSIENPVLYALSDNDEKDFVQIRPIETINAILQKKYETIELMQGYHRLMQQHQRIKQQYNFILSSKRSNNNSFSQGYDGGIDHSHLHDTSNGHGQQGFFNGDKNDETLEKLIDLLELEAEGMAPLATAGNTPNTSFVSIHQQRSSWSAGASLASTAKSASSHQATSSSPFMNDNDRFKELVDLNKLLADEVAKLKEEKSNAIMDLAKVRDYAADMQAQLEQAKRLHNDTMYDLRLSNELLRLREVEAVNRLNESQTLIQAKDELVRSLELNLADLTSKYEEIQQSSRSKEEETRRLLEDRDKERASLVDSLSQVSVHLGDVKREQALCKSNAETSMLNLANQIEQLTASNQELAKELSLLKHKLPVQTALPPPASSSTATASTSPTAATATDDIHASAQIKKLITTLGESEQRREAAEKLVEALRQELQGVREEYLQLKDEGEAMEVFHNMKITSLQAALDDQIQLTNQYEDLYKKSLAEQQSLSDANSTPIRKKTSDEQVSVLSPVIGRSSPILEGDSMGDVRFSLLQVDDQEAQEASAARSAKDNEMIKLQMRRLQSQAKTMAEKVISSNKEVIFAKEKLAQASAIINDLQQQILQLRMR
jgi:hypothetical protein